MDYTIPPPSFSISRSASSPSIRSTKSQSTDSIFDREFKRLSTLVSVGEGDEFESQEDFESNKLLDYKIKNDEIEYEVSDHDRHTSLFKRIQKCIQDFDAKGNLRLLDNVPTSTLRIIHLF